MPDVELGNDLIRAQSRYKHQIRLGLVCTGGGHFEQMVNLRDLYDHYPHFWITSRNSQTAFSLAGEKKYYLELAHFKKPWTYLFQIPKSIWIFAKERPTHLLSTGSGRIVLIPFLLSIAFRVMFIHIETFSHVNRLTKFGLFLAKVKHPIFSQWQKSPKKNIHFIGPIMKSETRVSPLVNKDNLVFVTLGNRRESFPRIIKTVETLIRKGIIKERVIVQAGHTSYQSSFLEIFSFCTPEEIDELILSATYVITQESAGIGTKCLRFGKRMIVMPREYSRGELPARSDMNEDLHIKLQELGYVFVVRGTRELQNAIENLQNLKVGYEFDNSRAIAVLRNLLEK